MKLTICIYFPQNLKSQYAKARHRGIGTVLVFSVFFISCIFVFTSSTAQEKFEGGAENPPSLVEKLDTKWNPNDVNTKIMNDPNPSFFGHYQFIDCSNMVQQREGWKITISPNKEHGVSVLIDEGPNGHELYLAKIIKVSKNEISIEHPPVPLGFYKLNFLLTESDNSQKIEALYWDEETGRWYRDSSWLERVRTAQ